MNMIMKMIHETPLGIQALRSTDGTSILILKTDKTHLLEAIQSRSIRVRAEWVPMDNGYSFLVLAFEIGIDSVRPICFYVPVNRSEHALDFYLMFSRASFNVYLADVNDCIVAAYIGRMESSGRTKNAVYACMVRDTWVGVHYVEHCLRFVRQMYGHGSPPVDDFDEIKLIKSENELVESTYVSNNNFVSRKSSVNRTLFREEAGELHESEIAHILARVFGERSVFHGPMRLTKVIEKEICDVLVVSDSMVLVIQAKDIPSTHDMLNIGIEKKEKKIKKQIQSGVIQLSGAIRELRRSDVLEFFVGDSNYSFDIRNRKLCGMVVVSELYTSVESFSVVLDEHNVARNWEFAARCVLNSNHLNGVPTLITDYYELDDICRNSDTEKRFSSIFEAQCMSAMVSGHYSRVVAWANC